MLRDIGISRAHQRVLVHIMDDLIGEPTLNVEVRRRAQYLKWGLEGYEPGEQPLDFIDDSPPLVPAGAEPVKQTAAT